MTVALAACLVACGSGGAPSDTTSPPPAAAPVDVTISGQPCQVWPAINSKRAVVWIHGRDQEQHMLGGPQATEITALHTAGWTIGSDYAHGNAWGDAQSVADYKALVAYLRTNLHVQQVVLLGASMGGLATLHLLKAGVADTAVLVSPVTNLRSMYKLPVAVPELTSIYGNKPPRSANPLAWSRKDFTGKSLTVLDDPADPVVPFATNSKRFTKKFGIKLLRCHGGHAAPACFARVSIG